MRPAKITISLLLLLLTLLLLACKADREPAEPTGIVPTGKPPTRNGPQEAWNVLTTCFQTKESGRTVYPPDYAGAWIEGEELHIAIAAKAERGEGCPDYESLLAGFDCVVFEEARYPLNDLLSLQDRVFRRLHETFKVYWIGPDEKENLLCLGVDMSEDKEQIYDRIDEILKEDGMQKGVFKDTEARDLFVIEDAEPVREE